MKSVILWTWHTLLQLLSHLSSFNLEVKIDMFHFDNIFHENTGTYNEFYFFIAVCWLDICFWRLYIRWKDRSPAKWWACTMFIDISGMRYKKHQLGKMVTCTITGCLFFSQWKRGQLNGVGLMTALISSNGINRVPCKPIVLRSNVCSLDISSFALMHSLNCF